MIPVKEISGIIMLASSLVLLSKGQILPLVISIALVYSVINAPPIKQFIPEYNDRYDGIEEKSEILVNPWVGFLQEDVYKNPQGSIGNFTGNEEKLQGNPIN